MDGCGAKPRRSELRCCGLPRPTLASASQLNARQGAAMLTVDQANDGVNYFFASGDIATGTFALYGLSK